MDELAPSRPSAAPESLQPRRSDGTSSASRAWRTDASHIPLTGPWLLPLPIEQEYSYEALIRALKGERTGGGSLLLRDARVAVQHSDASVEFYQLEARIASIEDKQRRIDAQLSALDRSRFKWPPVCEDSFRQLATIEPTKLIGWIRSGALPATALAYATEALGEIEDCSLVIEDLIKLSRHDKPYVREAAVSALAAHSDSSTRALARLREMATTDPNPAIQELAVDELDE